MNISHTIFLIAFFSQTVSVAMEAPSVPMEMKVTKPSKARAERPASLVLSAEQIEGIKNDKKTTRRASVIIINNSYTNHINSRSNSPVTITPEDFPPVLRGTAPSHN